MTSKMNFRVLLNGHTLGVVLVTVLLHWQLVRAAKGSRQLGQNQSAKSNTPTSVSKVAAHRVEEIDLLHTIRVPFPSKSLSYVVGYDGFPAFGFGERADVKSPYRLSLPERLYRDFAVLATVRADSVDAGGFLFAVVNPSATIVQLGVRLSACVNELRNVSLFYTDVEMHVVSQVVAVFNVPIAAAAARQWIRLAIRVEANNATLYWDCHIYKSATVHRKPRELLFDSASTLYIGQAGPLIKGKFHGAIQELKLSNSPGLAEVQCYDVHYPAPITTFPNNGDARGDMDIDDVEPDHDVKPGASTTDASSSLQPGPPPLITPPPPGPTGDLDADSSSGFISMIGGSGEGSGMGIDDQMLSGFRGPPGPRGPPGVCSCNISEFMDVLPVPDTRANGVPGLSGGNGINISDGALGPKGDIGPIGLKGDRGEKGEAGETGERGERGESGLPGPPGKSAFDDGSGDDGDDVYGVDGMMGRPIRNGIGPQGPRGDDGLKGDPGETGEPGPEGSKGERGQDGIPGETGAQGSKGHKGDKGDLGVGEPGPPGPTGNSTCDANSCAGAKVKGDVGPQGPPGSPGLNGLMGLDGQSGTKGEKGSSGLPGSSGSKGESGEPGMPGKVVQLGDSIAYVQGDKGARGERGKRGRRGKLGPPGVRGPDGKPGTPGEIGIPGFPGRSGKQGPPGIATKGDKGDAGPPGSSCSDLSMDCGGSTSQGPPGDKGSKGDVGPPGSSKNDGFYPVVGLPGPPGPPGSPGLSIEGEKGSAGTNGQPGRMGSPGPPGPPGPAGFGRLGELRRLKELNYLIGPPGPMGPPGPQGPPGNPGQASSDNYISPNIVPGAVTFKDLNAMLKMSRVSPVGTLAYIIDEQALLVRVNNGWQYVALGSLVDIPTEAPITSTTDLPAQIMPQVESLVANGPSLRMAALNEPHVGDMHGVRGADYACYRQARVAGIRGTFRAFLSSRVQNLDSIVRYTDRGLPVVNIRGDPLFSSWKEIFAGARGQFHYQARIYSFDGRSVLTDNSWPQKFVWHGSNKFGERAMDSYCDAWHSNNKDKLGLASPLLESKLLDEQKFACNNAYIVLCVEATSQNEVTTVTSSSSRRRKRRDIANESSSVELSAAEYELYLQEIMDDDDDDDDDEAATL